MGQLRNSPGSGSSKIRNEKGAVMVEYAYTIGVFLFIIIGILDLSRIMFQKLALEYSLNKAARWGILGQTIADPQNPLVQLTRERSIEETLRNSASNYGLTIDPAEIQICPASTPNCSPDDAGGPSTLTLISIDRAVPVIFKSFALHITASILIKNEPYS